MTGGDATEPDSGAPDGDAAPAPGGDAAPVPGGGGDGAEAPVARRRRGEAPIGPLDDMADAARTVLARELRRLRKMEPGTRSGADPEDLHQMRVASRRIRTALDLFASALDPVRSGAARSALRPVAASLGEVRDLDVLLDGLRGYITALPPHVREDLDPLRADWLARRTLARQRLIEALDSDSYQTALAELRSLASKKPVTGQEHSTVRDAAPPRIRRALDRVAARRPASRHTPIRDLHALRIEAKHLRYSLEFFQTLLGSGFEEIVGPVIRLQEELGLFHDADVGACLAEELLERDEPSLKRRQRRAIRDFVKQRRREVETVRRHAPALWQACAGRASRRRVREALAAVA